MIPSIEEICYGLENGKYNSEQAIAWMEQHEYKGNERKEVALALLAGMLCNGFLPAHLQIENGYVAAAYKMADEFISKGLSKK